MDIEPPRAPQYFESDLDTSETETDEEFYDEHPLKEAHEQQIKRQAQLTAQSNTNLPASHNNNNNSHHVDNAYFPNGENINNEIDEKKERRKFKKKKRDKRQQPQHMNNNNNNNNNNNGVVEFEAENTPKLKNINNYEQSNMLFNNNSCSGMPTNHVLGREGYTAHIRPFGATQTFVTRALSIASEGGGSSSEADSSLKRSKRMRRPNKFYGYTSDDETTSGPSLMIGTRKFKPQPPPHLTWNKDDLPSPSKSILNNSKSNKSNKKTPKTEYNNLNNAFGEFADLINHSGRKRTFGIAAGGKVGDVGSALYKRAAKKTKTKIRKMSSAEEDSNYHLPPIPRLKINPTQLRLNSNMSVSESDNTSFNAVHVDSTSSSCDSSSDFESDISQLPLSLPIGNTQAAKTLNVRPNLQLRPFGTPPITNHIPAHLPAALSTPIPKTTAFNHSIPPALLPNPDFATLQYFKVNNIRYPIRPPAGARQAREGESVYCYCRCPYDEVSEMIACDGDNCVIEWFHFECVGIMVPPQGKWYCAECRPQYSAQIYANLQK